MVDCDHCDAGLVLQGAGGLLIASMCACSACYECNSGYLYTAATGERNWEWAPCACLPIRRAAALITAAGIPSRYRSASLARSPTPEQLEGWSAAAALELGEPAWLYGPPGSGKTPLLVAGILAGSRRGREFHFLNWPELVAIGRLDSYSGANTAPYELATTVQGHVVIDDLCPLGRVADQRLLELVRRRYDHELPTSCASRLTPAALGAKLGGDLVSRLPGQPAELALPRGE